MGDKISDMFPDPEVVATVRFIDDEVVRIVNTDKLILIPDPTTSTQNDFIDDGGGHDCLAGTQGNDVIKGGNGADLLLEVSGNDIMFGGKGDDALFGESGNDVPIGGDGYGHLDGGANNDWLIGGDTNIHSTMTERRSMS